MDFQHLPEPWDVQVFYPGEHTWRKPRNCKNIYLHLCASAGGGGSGESGPSGTKRAGGSGGGGSSRTNYYGPSIAFEEYLIISVPDTTPQNSQGSNCTARFPSTVGAHREFVAVKGGAGIAGSGGVGGAAATFINIGAPSTPPGIVRYQVTTLWGRSISNSGAGGYSASNPTNPHAGQGSSPLEGSGGGGITDVYDSAVNTGTRGASITFGGGEGNGLINPVPAINYVSLRAASTEGALGVQGNSWWYTGKPFYLATAGTGGNASLAGTGGKGGDGGIGCGGGGGGAGVTGGQGGLGGHGIAIVVSW